MGRMGKMKIKGFAAIALVLLSLCLCACSNGGRNNDTEMVYICVSETAYAYHSNKYCQGLENCTHEIRKVSKNEAEEKYGRRPCRRCANTAVLDAR